MAESSSSNAASARFRCSLTPVARFALCAASKDEGVNQSAISMRMRAHETYFVEGFGRRGLDAAATRPLDSGRTTKRNTVTAAWMSARVVNVISNAEYVKRRGIWRTVA